VVVSGGFAEVRRRDLEEELINVARKYGVGVLGPNCVGVYNAFNGLDATFLPAEKATRPPPGPAAFLSQSGGRGWSGRRHSGEFRQQGRRDREVVTTPSRAAKALSAVAFYGSKIYNSGNERRQKHEAG
jgi:hypothetical protein